MIAVVAMFFARAVGRRVMGTLISFLEPTKLTARTNTEDTDIAAVLFFKNPFPSSLFQSFGSFLHPCLLHQNFRSLCTPRSCFRFLRQLHHWPLCGVPHTFHC